MVAVAAIAVAWANSPWRDLYFALWDTPMGLRLGSFAFERSLGWVVNDVLMVAFFFVVGLEIRREIHEGELSTWRRAALPMIAAVGGMVVPALVYFAIAGAAPTSSGWGVPMATDIAFAVGIPLESCSIACWNARRICAVRRVAPSIASERRASRRPPTS